MRGASGRHYPIPHHPPPPLPAPPGVHGPAYLESRILEFLAGFVSTLRGMPEEEFENHRAAVISAKMLKVCVCVWEASVR